MPVRSGYEMQGVSYDKKLLKIFMHDIATVNVRLGAPRRNRTPDQELRRLLLCPSELWAR